MSLVFTLIYGPLPKGSQAAETGSELGEVVTDFESSQGHFSGAGGLQTSVGPNGNLNFSFPFMTLPGRASEGAPLSIGYNSNTRNALGALGSGWDLQIPTIKRIPPSDFERRPDFGYNDRFSTDLGVLVPMTDPRAEEVEYRLEGGPFNHHFTFDKSLNCWFHTDLSSAKQRVFCQTKMGPYDRNEKLPVEYEQRREPLPDWIIDFLDEYDPRAIPVDQIEPDTDAWDDADVDWDWDPEDSVDTSKPRTDRFVIPSASKEVQKVIAEAGLEDLDRTHFDPDRVPGDEPLGGSEPLGMTAGDSSQRYLADSTDQWWLTAVVDLNGNRTQYYYTLYQNVAGFNVFQLKGVCWDLWNDPEQDPEIAWSWTNREVPVWYEAGHGPQFCFRLVYDRRTDYYPVRGRTVYPQLLSAVELYPVIDYRPGEPPILDGDHLNVAYEFDYYQPDYSSSGIRFGEPMLKTIRTVDGEGTPIVPPVEFDYNNPTVPTRRIKAFCDEPDIYRFYKPSSPTEAEWITKTDTGFPWTNEKWLNQAYPGDRDRTIPYVTSDHLPTSLRTSYLDNGSYNYQGLSEVSHIERDAGVYRLTKLSKPPGDNLKHRPDFVTMTGFFTACRIIDGVYDYLIPLDYKTFFDFVHYVETLDDNNLATYCDNPTPSEAPVGSVAFKDSIICWEDPGQCLDEYINYGNDVASWAYIRSDLPVEDYFYYGGVYFPIINSRYWMLYKDLFVLDFSSDFAFVYNNLPPDQCPESTAPPGRAADDKNFGGCFVMGPYLWGPEDSFLGLDLLDLEIDLVGTSSDLDSDGFSDIVWKGGDFDGDNPNKDDFCPIVLWNNAMSYEVDGEERPLSAMLDGRWERCDPSTYRDRYHEWWYNSEPFQECANKVSELVGSGYCWRFGYLLPDKELGARDGTHKEDNDLAPPHKQRTKLTDCDGDGDLDWIATVYEKDARRYSSDMEPGLYCWWNNASDLQEMEGRGLIDPRTGESYEFDPDDVAFCRIPTILDDETGEEEPFPGEVNKGDLLCPVKLENFPLNQPLALNDEETSKIDFVRFGNVGPGWWVDIDGPHSWHVLPFCAQEYPELCSCTNETVGCFADTTLNFLSPREPISEWDDKEGEGKGIIHFGSSSKTWTHQNNITDPPYYMYCETDKDKKDGDKFVWTCWPYKEGDPAGDGFAYVGFFNPQTPYEVLAPISAPQISGERGKYNGEFNTTTASMIDMNGDNISDIVVTENAEVVGGWEVYHGCTDQGKEDRTSCERCPENRPFEPDAILPPTFGGGLLTKISYGYGREERIEWESAEQFKFEANGIDNPVPSMPMVREVRTTDFKGLEAFYQGGDTDTPWLTKTYEYRGCFSDPDTGEFVGCPAVKETTASEVGTLEITTYYLMQFPSSWGDGYDVADYSELNPPDDLPASEGPIRRAYWPSSEVRESRLLKGFPWARVEESFESFGDIQHLQLYHRIATSVSLFPSVLPEVTEGPLGHRFLLTQPDQKVEILEVESNDPEIETDLMIQRQEIVLQDPTETASDPTRYVGYVAETRNYGIVGSGDLTQKEINEYVLYSGATVPHVVPVRRCRVEGADSSTDTCPNPYGNPDIAFYKEFEYDSNGRLVLQRKIIEDRYGNQPTMEEEYRYDRYGHPIEVDSRHYIRGERIRYQTKHYDYRLSDYPGDIDTGRFVEREAVQWSGDQKTLVQYFDHDRSVSQLRASTRPFYLGSENDPGSFENCDEACMVGGTTRRFDLLGRPIEKVEHLPASSIRQCFYYSTYSEDEPWGWAASVTRADGECWAELPSEPTLKKYPYQKSYQNGLGVLRTERSSDGESILIQEARYDRDGVRVAQSQWGTASEWASGDIQWSYQRHDPQGRITRLILTTGDAIEITGGVVDVSYFDPNWTSGEADGHRRHYVADSFGRLKTVSLEATGTAMTASYSYGLVGDADTIELNAGDIVIDHQRDSYGRIVETERPETGTRRIVYDAAGLILMDQAIDAEGSVIRTRLTKYDGLGRPVRMVALSSNDYDDELRINGDSPIPDIDSFDEPSVETNFEYGFTPDVFSSSPCFNEGRIARKERIERWSHSEDFIELQEFCWDAAGRIYKQRATHYQYGTGEAPNFYEVEHFYDDYGRLITRIDRYEGGEGETSGVTAVYRWQEHLPLLVSDSSAGAAMEVLYKDRGEAKSRIIIDKVLYDTRARPVLIWRGDGTALDYRYDEHDRLEAILACLAEDVVGEACDDWQQPRFLVNQRITERDPAGDTLEVVEGPVQWRSDSFTYRYTYDGLHQLTGAEVTGSSTGAIYWEEFSYDRLGNRTEYFLNTQDSSHDYDYEYGDSHHLQEVRDLILSGEEYGNIRCFEWHGDGTLYREWVVEEGGGCETGTPTDIKTFYWSAEGRLRSVSVQSETIETYFYGAEGLRVRKVQDFPDYTQKVTDYFGKILSVVNGSPIRYFNIPGGSTIVASLEDPNLEFESADPPDQNSPHPTPCGLFTSADPLDQNPWGFLIVFLYLILLIGLWRWRIVYQPGGFEAMALGISVILLIQTVTAPSASAHTANGGRRPAVQVPSNSIRVDGSKVEVVRDASQLNDIRDRVQKDRVECQPNPNSNLRFFINDLRGNRVVTTDAEGCPLEGLAYTAFGDDACEIDPALCYQDDAEGLLHSSTDPAFIGRVRDEATGLIATDRRYYDPSLGIFISPDPLDEATLVATGGNAQDKLYRNPIRFHPYTYSGNNPIIRSDPSGMFFISTTLLIVAIIVSGVAYSLASFAYAEIAGDGDGWRELLQGLIYTAVSAVAAQAGFVALAKLGISNVITQSLWLLASSKIASGISGTILGDDHVLCSGKGSSCWEKPWRNIRDSYSRPGTVFFDALAFMTGASDIHLRIDNEFLKFALSATYAFTKTALRVGIELDYIYAQYRRLPFRAGLDNDDWIVQQFAFTVNSLAAGLALPELGKRLLDRCGDGTKCAEECSLGCELPPEPEPMTPVEPPILLPHFHYISGIERRAFWRGVADRLLQYDYGFDTGDLELILDGLVVFPANPEGGQPTSFFTGG